MHSDVTMAADPADGRTWAEASEAARSAVAGEADRVLLDCGRFKLTGRGIRFMMTDPRGSVVPRDLPWGNVRWMAAGVGREWGLILLSTLASIVFIAALFWFVIMSSDARGDLAEGFASAGFWTEYQAYHTTFIIYGVFAFVVPGCMIALELTRTGRREGWMEIRTRGDVLLEGLLYGVPEKKIFRKMKGEPVRFIIDASHAAALALFLDQGGPTRRPGFAERLLWRVNTNGRARRLD